MSDLYPIVKIIWDDSITDNGRWKTIEEAIEWHEGIASDGVTVGHLLFDDVDHIVVSLSVMYHTKERRHADTVTHNVIRIPKGCIKEVKYLISDDTQDK